MTKKQLDDLLKGLKQWGDDLRNSTKDKPDFKFNDQNQNDPVPDSAKVLLKLKLNETDTMRQLLALAAELAPPQPGSEEDRADLESKGASITQFDEFMVSLAESVVATQKKLDIETANYLLSIADKPHIQPTTFRMPKLEAQMKFGLTVSGKSKLNLVFWGKESSTTEQNQQGINFEIVSAPAPPGAIESARQGVPQWNLVLDPFTRGELLEKIRTLPHTPNDVLDPLVIAAGSEPERLVLVQLQLGDVAKYLVFYSKPPATKDVGIWLMSVAAQGQASVNVIYRFTRAAGVPEEEQQWHDLVESVANKQLEFFRK